jgi:hypothetical protein
VDRADRDKIVFLVCGIAVMTLVLQGSTTNMLVRRLGLDRPSEAELQVFDRAAQSLEGALQEDIDRYKVSLRVPSLPRFRLSLKLTLKRSRSS